MGTNHTTLAGAVARRLKHLDVINKKVHRLLAASNRTPPYKGKAKLVDRMLDIHREIGLLLSNLELDLANGDPASAQLVERRRDQAARKL